LVGPPEGLRTRKRIDVAVSKPSEQLIDACPIRADRCGSEYFSKTMWQFQLRQWALEIIGNPTQQGREAASVASDRSMKALELRSALGYPLLAMTRRIR
jgi:hypothetical protein